MIDWLRRVDPAFYHKEPYLLRAQAQIERYTDEAQGDVRLSVLTADPLMRAATAVVALSAYAAASGIGALGPRGDRLTAWALAVLAVAAPRALPWWPHPGGRAWLDALIGGALVAIPAAWMRVDAAIFGIALLSGATLLATRGRGRAVLLVAATGVLFGVRTPVHLLAVAPLAGVFAAGVSVLVVRAIGRVWRRRPQAVTWSACATLLVACAYTVAFEAPVVASRVPVEIAAIGVGYIGVCIIAGRIRRAEMLASPNGVVSLPQSIVPLLDRSHHHAVICWLA